MSCPACQKNNEVLTTKHFEPCTCAQEECATPNPCVESFNAQCIIHTLDDLVCNQEVIVPSGTNVSEALRLLLAKMCNIQLTPGPQGPTGPAGADGLNELIIGNTLIVSALGNDATGTRNDWAKPFLTIQAANSAAQPNDLVIIFPGSYNLGGSPFNKNNVSYYVYKNAIIQGTGNLIMDGGIAFEINIYGEGTFVSTGARAFFTINPSTNIHFKFDSAVGLLDGITIGSADKVYIRGKYTSCTVQYCATVRGDCEGIMDIDIYDGSNSQGAETIFFRNHSLDGIPRKFTIKGTVLSNTSGFSGAFSIEASPGLILDASECNITHNSGFLNASVAALFQDSGKLKFGGKIETPFNTGIVISNSLPDPTVLLLKDALVNSEFTTMSIASINCFIEIDGCDLTKGPNQVGSTILVAPVTTACELEIRNSVICNQGESASDHGIGTGDENSIIRLDDVKIALNPLTGGYSLASSVVRTMHIETIFTSNAVLDPNVTNDITGSLVIIDPMVGTNTLKFN